MGFMFVDGFGYHRKICISKNDEKTLQAPNKNTDKLCPCVCLNNDHAIKQAPSAKIICNWNLTLELGSVSTCGSFKHT